MQNCLRGVFVGAGGGGECRREVRLEGKLFIYLHDVDSSSKNLLNFASTIRPNLNEFLFLFLKLAVHCNSSKPSYGACYWTVYLRR